MITLSRDCQHQLQAVISPVYVLHTNRIQKIGSDYELGFDYLFFRKQSLVLIGWAASYFSLSFFTKILRGRSTAELGKQRNLPAGSAWGHYILVFEVTVAFENLMSYPSRITSDKRTTITLVGPY